MYTGIRMFGDRSTFHLIECAIDGTILCVGVTQDHL